MRCKFCGTPRVDWLTVEVSRRFDGTAFRFYVTAEGSETGVSTFGAQDAPGETWFVCRFGHLRAKEQPLYEQDDSLKARALRRLMYGDSATQRSASVEQSRVVGFLGSTGGGKSQLVRALRQEVVPPQAHLAPADVRALGDCVLHRDLRIEEGARLGAGHLAPTNEYQETVRRRIENFLRDNSQPGRATSDDLSDVLRRGLWLEDPDPAVVASAERQWGTSRAPYILDLECRRGLVERHLLEVLVDLPGEVLRVLMGDRVAAQINPADLAALRFASHLLLNVDALALPGLFDGLSEPEQLASLRKGDETLRTRHREARAQANDLLANIVHMRRELPDWAHRTIVLTKCDVIHRGLQKSPGPSQADELARWWWAQGASRSSEDFLATATDTLLHLSRDSVRATPEATKLLRLVGDAHSTDARVAERVARDILGCFGEPEAFWNLVAAGREQHLDLAGVGVTLEAIHAYWFHSTGGRMTQVRDIVSAVIASALLGAEFGRNTVAGILAQGGADFVLTSTREFLAEDGTVREADDPRAVIGANNAGVLHLMGRLLQEAHDG